MNRFIVSEPANCIGCRTCEVACVLAHNPTAIADGLSAAGFRPRLHLIQTLKTSAPVTCRQCEDAPCVNSCPTAAISYADQTVQIDQSRCIGCKTCVVACPFGAMEVVSSPAFRSFAGVQVADGMKTEAQKCDLCRNRPGGPACIEVCPTDALHVMSEERITELRRRRQERAVAETSVIV